MLDNPILDTDSYKASHWLQYPPSTVGMTSYLEARGGEFSESVFFGLQYLMQEYLTRRIYRGDVEEARVFFRDHGEPFNYDGWMHIVENLEGKFPIEILAVPEGSIIPIGNILLKVRSTDPHAFWVVSWLETQIMRLWYPINVATISREVKKIILGYLRQSSDDPEGEIPFKLHDFGGRGVTCREQAKIGGAAHLVNFQGTDTVAGVRMANEYYGSAMAGFSIPASEHSSITSWGRENESKAYANMLEQFGQKGKIFACVSDSYDIYTACERLWGTELKNKVIESGATVVIRPDSGHPQEVTSACLEILGGKFGWTRNGKGYKVLDHVRIIYGDGMNLETVAQPYYSATSTGWSATNITVGMGGGLLQKHDRDTMQFAFKCCEITREIDGKRFYVPVYKQPVDQPEKNSKSGDLDLIREMGQYFTVNNRSGLLYNGQPCLVPVYRNGRILQRWTFEEVRERAGRGL